MKFFRRILYRLAVFFTIYILCDLSYAVEGCLTTTNESGETVIYNTSYGGDCEILYNVGTNPDDIGDAQNEVGENLDEILAGIPCYLNTNTDNFFNNYRDGLVSLDINIQNGSNVVLSCQTGYHLIDSNKNTVNCSNGEMSYNFVGCAFDKNRGTDLETTINDYFRNLTDSVYSIDDLTVETGVFENSTIYDIETVVTFSCNEKEDYILNSDKNILAFKALGNQQWSLLSECEYVTKPQGCSEAVNPFEIETIDTDEITISYYTGSENGSNNCIVDWGDGSVDTCQQESNYHKYSISQTYIVKICGESFRGIGVKLNSNIVSKVSQFVSDISTNGSGNFAETYQVLNNSNGDDNRWVKKIISYGSWDNITTMSFAFANSQFLTEIQANAFDGIPNVVSFDYAFVACINLTTIPLNLFVNNSKATNFTATFAYCPSLKSIPNTLFNSGAKNFTATFAYSNLQSIPNTLFSNNLSIDNFSAVFFWNTNLSCTDIDGMVSDALATSYDKWPSWSADSVNMSYAKKCCSPNMVGYCSAITLEDNSNIDVTYNSKSIPKVYCYGATPSWGYYGSVVEAGDYYENGTIATVSCDEGFYFDGGENNTITCSAGNWGEFTGECKPVVVSSCSAFDNSTINNSIVEYSTAAVDDLYTEGTIATVSCDEGFYFDGGENNTITCSAGNWGEFTGECKPVVVSSCSAFDNSTINNSIVEYSTAAVDDLYTEGTIATVSCDEGFYFDGGENNTITCSAGNWGELSGHCISDTGCFQVLSKPTNSITINYYNKDSKNGVNDCTIYWGDGTMDTCTQTSNSHTYSSSLEKQWIVKICGSGFKGIGGSMSNTNTWIRELISYGNWDQITDMSYAFANVYPNGNVTYSDEDDLAKKYNVQFRKVHSNAFDGIPNVVNFTGVFYNCGALSHIPDGLFKYNTEVKDFSYAFHQTWLLSSIPQDLFKYNNKVTSFREVFYYNNNLKCVAIDGGDSPKVVSNANWSKWNETGVDMDKAKYHCDPISICLPLSSSFVNNSIISYNLVDVNEPEMYYNGTIAIFKCIDGYRWKGSDDSENNSYTQLTMHCVDGEWINLDGDVANDSCVKPCYPFNLSLVENANIFYSDGYISSIDQYNSSTEANLICKVGYEWSKNKVSAENKIICSDDGEWSSIDDTCVKKCLSYDNSRNGHSIVKYSTVIDENGNFSVGTIATVTCATGYKWQNSFDSANILTCDNGNWGNIDDICLRMCPAYDYEDDEEESSSRAIEHSVITYNTDSVDDDKYVSGTVAVLSCKDGYKWYSTDNATYTSTCNEGNWDLVNDSCISTCSNYDNIISNSTVVEYSMDAINNEYPMNTEVSVVCNDGYKWSRGEDEIVKSVCTSDGWTVIEDTCNRTCGAFDTSTVANAVVSYDRSADIAGGYEDETVATFVCQGGYKWKNTLENSIVSVCNAGVWNPIDDYCIKSCSPFDDEILNENYVANSTVFYDSEINIDGTYSFGTKAIVSCKNTYKWENTEDDTIISICEAGSWSKVNDFCSKKCPVFDNSSIANSLIESYSIEADESNLYSSGAIATLGCKAGYQWNGKNTVSCDAGNWETVSGKCEIKNCEGESGSFEAITTNTNLVTINYYSGTKNGENNCRVDWGDGTVDFCAVGTDSQIHRYDNSSIHTIRICGDYFKGLYQNNRWIKKLVSYGQWNNITTMESAFKNDENLEEVSANAFDGVVNVTDFSYSFSYDKKLKTIGDNLFAKNDKVETFEGIFYQCESLKTIPSNIFAKNLYVSTFSKAFAESGIIEVPAGLFSNNINVINFSRTFEKCSSLTSIDSGLFNNNSAVADFSYLFNGCSNLQCKAIDGENSSNVVRNSWAKWANGANIISAKYDCFEVAEKPCSPINISSVDNANVIYSNPISEGKYDSKTTAYLSCRTGYRLVESNIDMAECRDGNWSNNLSGQCEARDMTGKCAEDSGSFEVITADNISTVVLRYYTGEEHGDNDCIVDWGDGSYEVCNARRTIQTHRYATRGHYTIRICGGNFVGVVNQGNISEIVSYGNWSNIKSMKDAFISNKVLTKIHPNAFSGIANVTTFENAFNNCSALNSIPDNLFDNNKEVESFQYTFKGTSNLAKIPAGLFKNNTKVKNIEGVFSNSGLTSIPVGLFDNLVNVVSFYGVFEGNPIKSIPAGLFKNNTKVESFMNTFSNNKQLSLIPDNLFSNNKSVKQFDGVFDGDENLECEDIDGLNHRVDIGINQWSKWRTGLATTNLAKNGCKLKPKCKAFDNSSFSNSTVIYSTSADSYGEYYVLTTATMQCDSGYEWLGGSNVTSCSGTNWNDTVRGGCVKKCSAYVPTANASVSGYNRQVTSDRTYSNGTVATVKCNAGAFWSNGSSNNNDTFTTTCSAGEWSKISYVCNRQCSNPTAQTNATWNPTTVRSGLYTNLYCNNGYVQVGSKTATCNDGTWSYNGDILCYKNCTLSGLKDLKYNQENFNTSSIYTYSKYWYNSSGTSISKPTAQSYNHGTVYKASCPTNSKHELGAVITMTCSNGNWSKTNTDSCSGYYKHVSYKNSSPSAINFSRSGVRRYYVCAYGGSGDTGWSCSGRGGKTCAYITGSPSFSIQVFAGGEADGANGGHCCGKSCGYGADGGRDSNVSAGNGTILAGGGGGGSEGCHSYGGAGGGNNNNGGWAPHKHGAYGGERNRAGWCPNGCSDGQSGSGRWGGRGGQNGAKGKWCGGGGGNGWYGGGGGDYDESTSEVGGGGGGSGYCGGSNVSGCSGSNGVNWGSGYVEIWW